MAGRGEAPPRGGTRADELPLRTGPAHRSLAIGLAHWLLASALCAQAPPIDTAAAQATRPQIGGGPSWDLGLSRWHLPLLLSPALDEPLHRWVHDADDRLGDVSSEVGRVFGEHTFLIPGMVAAYAVGKLGDLPSVEEASIQSMQAWVVASAATGVLKLAFGRERPYEEEGPGALRPFSGATSFPSGHTTAAFAVATVLDRRVEFPGSSVVFYGFATLTAASRVYDHKHWLSDVVVGALVGHISGRWASRR